MNIKALDLYIAYGIMPGDFLQCILENDLRGACEHADIKNRYLLFDYVAWLYNHAPSGCWGSKTKVREWSSAKRAA